MAVEDAPEMSSVEQRKQEARAAYATARTRLFNMKVEDIGLAPPPDGSDVWGVAIDYPLSQPTLTCTLVILADGTVNLFLSEGPLIVGAGQHREVARAADKVLANARLLHSGLQPTFDFSVPDNNRPRVFLLTSAGVLGEEVSPRGSSDKQRRMAELVRQGDDVITAIRKRSESLDAKAKQFDARFNPKDNLLQAKIIGGSFAFCALTGAIAAPLRLQGVPFWAGAIMGSLVGLVLGFFGSGILLMAIRAKRKHAR